VNNTQGDKQILHLSLNKSWLKQKEAFVALVIFVSLAIIPIFISGYTIYILPQYMLFGVLAMSLGLMWGFVGNVSFGQAAFFVIGAYAMGLSMKGLTWGNPAYIGIFLAIMLGGFVAALCGYFLFSAGVRGSYFVLITLALSIIAEQVAVSQSHITGGWNGMFIDRMQLSFGPFGKIDLNGDIPIYYVILIVTTFLYCLMRMLIHSKFGRVLVGIRENEDRALALGFNTTLYKTAAFAISGSLACLAGALYATHANFVAPSSGGVLFSTEVVVWVAIGGRASILGALVGGITVSSMSNYLSAITPEYWQFFLGLLFIFVILFFKGGVAGALSRVFNGNKKGGP